MSKKKKNKKSPYIHMVLNLSKFVNRTATKDNPTSAELDAMVEISKLLFRTVWNKWERKRGEKVEKEKIKEILSQQLELLQKYLKSEILVDDICNISKMILETIKVLVALDAPLKLDAKELSNIVFGQYKETLKNLDFGPIVMD